MFLIIKMEIYERWTVSRVLKWNSKMAYRCHCWVLVVLSFFVVALMKHILTLKIFLVAQYFCSSVSVFVQQSVQNTVSLCLCSSQCRTQCHCVCAAVSAEHSVIVIAKCWSILYWSKNQLQTVCYENFLMLCLTGRHRETIRYYTAWCWSILLDILQHYVEVYCLIQYLHHSIVFQQIQTQEGNIRNKT